MSKFKNNKTEEKIICVVIKPFFDRYTKEYYPNGTKLTITKERYEEILKVDKLVEQV